MYVSDDLKLLYIHIPKTGGTAVREMLSSHYLTRLGERHNCISSLEDPEKYRDYFIFTIVRNPYDRLISMYRFQCLYSKLDTEKHLRRWGTHNLQETALRSFSDFVKNRKRHRIPVCQYEFVRHDFLRVKVFRYEDGAHDQIKEWLGIQESSVKDENTNFLGGYDKSEWSDEDGLKLISKYCSEDFKRFGYERG